MRNRVRLLGCAAALVIVWACADPQPLAGGRQDTARAAERFDTLRRAMVDGQLRARGIRNEAVLAAMAKVPRHRFVLASDIERAYADRPLAIGHGQTISQPYIVGYMTEALQVAPGDRILEIGTGSGYQAAILAELAREVYTIEIVPELGERAKALLQELGYRNVQVRIGDGYLGWPEHQPFDGIIVTAAPDHIPEPLVAQLAPSGRMIIPVGRGDQQLIVVSRTAEGVVQKALLDVRFVPLVREQKR